MSTGELDEFCGDSFASDLRRDIGVGEVVERMAVIVDNLVFQDGRLGVAWYGEGEPIAVRLLDNDGVRHGGWVWRGRFALKNERVWKSFMA